MANETVQIRVTAELKEQAEAVFKAMGLKTSEAIRLFLQQTVNTGGLPFQPMTRQSDPPITEAVKEPKSDAGESLENPDTVFRTWYAD